MIMTVSYADMLDKRSLQTSVNVKGSRGRMREMDEGVEKVRIHDLVKWG